jgi:integrase
VDRSGLRRHPPSQAHDRLRRPGYRKALREAGKAPGTINRYLSALHKVLAWGAARGRQHVTVMPEFSWQDEDEGRIRYLSPDEETRLIATLRALGYDEAADLCIVAIDTGCRRGELLAAQPDQIDGKWLRLWQTKNGHARSVPLTSRAREILLAGHPGRSKSISSATPGTRPRLRWACRVTTTSSSTPFATPGQPASSSWA